MNAGMADGHIHTFDVKEDAVAMLAGHPRITAHVADANSEAGLGRARQAFRSAPIDLLCIDANHSATAKPR